MHRTRRDTDQIFEFFYANFAQNGSFVVDTILVHVAVLKIRLELVCYISETYDRNEIISENHSELYVSIYFFIILFYTEIELCSMLLHLQ